MNIIYKGKNTDVTPALKDHCEKKLSHLAKIMEPDKVTVTLSKAHRLDKAEILVTVKGYLLRGEDHADDMYSAIDSVAEKLEKQLVRYKEKLQRKTKKDKKNLADVPAEVIPPEDKDELVRTKHFQVKPMDTEEAIMQMNMLGHNFFVFANSEQDEEINVIYLRNDGKYGLIIPEK